MSTYRKIQIALGTILLWSSTAVTSFAATNTITAGTFQSDTLKLSVESIPSKPLNLTQDTYLIAGELRDMLSRIPGVYDIFKNFDEIWKNPADRQKRLFDYCNTQKNVEVDQCFNFLRVWVMDQFESDNDDFEELIAINEALIERIRQ
ncbi:MAG TPA: hypothetical protein DCL61_13235 [Cyanobacteria bacterium UBA12227]|nr:hypothetical protein [Cyanobacteria bacterium UBA12227]HAX88484.1 hypothetical protein [Cyanobacteria bacterium UBA11370]HBY81453.1 hypothetical protein [Cyanobacteria bacterium UBA11148]